MSIIILEGVDKCGKSTIARKLEKDFGYTYVHFSNPKPGEKLFDTYSKALDHAKGNVVFDRFIYGELCYGPVFRGKSQLSDKQVGQLEDRLLRLNSVLIYCHDEVRNIKRRFKEDDETFTKPELIKPLLDKYKDVLQWTALPVIKHKIKGTTDLTVGGKLRKLVNELKKHETKSR